MKVAGGVLITLGAIALLLWAEHLYSNHRRETSDEVLRSSILERMILPDANLGKAPTAEGVRDWSNRCRVGSWWMRRGVPSFGVLALLGGIVLAMVGSRSRREFLENTR